MPLEKWTKLGDELLSENPFWEYRKSRFVIPSGKEIDYFYTHHSGGSMVVGVSQEGRVAMVKQYRLTIDKFCLEFPAGKKQSGKNELETAAAEFAEETQFAARNIEPVGIFEVSPGLTDYVASVFIAHDLYPCPTAADETEDLEVSWFTPAEIDTMIVDGTITNAWTLSSWILTRSRVLELIAAKR